MQNIFQQIDANRNTMRLIADLRCILHAVLVIVVVMQVRLHSIKFMFTMGGGGGGGLFRSILFIYLLYSIGTYFPTIFHSIQNLIRWCLINCKKKQWFIILANSNFSIQSHKTNEKWGNFTIFELVFKYDCRGNSESMKRGNIGNTNNNEHIRITILILENKQCNVN